VVFKEVGVVVESVFVLLGGGEDVLVDHGFAAATESFELLEDLVGLEPLLVLVGGQFSLQSAA
jgi:hypothetical protein